MIRYEKIDFNNQHAFILFVFDTFSFLISETVDLLHIVQRVIHDNVMSPKSMNVVFEYWFCHPKRSSGAACCPLASYSHVSKIDSEY